MITMNKTIPKSEADEKEKILLCDLLQCLVECSEKSSKIAQIFREENDLFNLLIQEKSQSESNKRFVQDFKTLADVLVQETIKMDVGKQFPQLVPQIQGEEQNSFKNAQGDSIDVILTDSVDETTCMLSKVLDGRKNFARAVANVVHSTDILCDRQYFAADTYPIHKLGIWIDPIDSTAEFIEGKHDDTEKNGVQQPNGLKCVCVLIGAYDLETSVPVMGVVNQPFHSKISDKEKWKSKFYWGMNYENSSIVSSSVQLDTFSDELNVTSEENGDEIHSDQIVVTSSSESIELQEIIKRQYKLVHSAGAGHKALLVAIKKADLYILSKSSTYFWDTCGPHAILNAAGGGMLRLKEAINDCEEVNIEFLKRRQVKYKPMPSKTGTEAFQNFDGILAYRNPNIALSFIKFLKNSGFVVL